MVNEAVLCRSENIIRNVRDGDVAAIWGLGFPPFRGGPFCYADEVGAEEIVRRLRSFERQFGLRFAPAPLLVELAETGGRFHATD
jgi:3-hydroxyacyl-CoA dehydrogenase/enoyl-CoA hydratase/3-hydroxybutyryl-CoA epimerase